MVDIMTKKTVYLVSFLMIVVLVLGFVFLKDILLEKSNKLTVEVYYKNNLSKNLEYETRFVSNTQPYIIFNDVFSLLLSKPKDVELSKASNEHIVLERLNYIENRKILEFYFSKDYYNMPNIEEIFFRTALVWTFTSLEDLVEEILFYVDEEPLKLNNNNSQEIFGRDNMLINPILSPDKSKVKEVTLYFANAKKTKLVAEHRNININPDNPIEKYIVEELIDGPWNIDLQVIIPKETKIRGVEVDKGVCYINVSSDFLDKLVADSKLERMAIFSIVNSLTVLPEINSVQFLVESEKIQIERGFLDLSLPIERNEDIIIASE